MWLLGYCNSPLLLLLEASCDGLFLLPLLRYQEALEELLPVGKPAVPSLLLPEPSSSNRCHGVEILMMMLLLLMVMMLENGVIHAMDAPIGRRYGPCCCAGLKEEGMGGCSLGLKQANVVKILLIAVEVQCVFVEIERQFPVHHEFRGLLQHLVLSQKACLVLLLLLSKDFIILRSDAFHDPTLDSIIRLLRQSQGKVRRLLLAKEQN